MFRPWQTAVAFVLCLAVVLTALGWVSVTVLRLDREQVAFQRQAALEENVRLALWRLDSAAAPILARENMRPFSDYTTMSAPVAPTPPAQNAAGIQSNVTSLSLSAPTADVLLYCQFAPDGACSSPQVPPGKPAPVADNRVPTSGSVQTAAQRLAWVRDTIDPKDLLASVPQAATTFWWGTPGANSFTADANGDRTLEANSNGVIVNQPQALPPAANVKLQQQVAKNTAEFAARSQRINPDNYGQNRFIAASPQWQHAVVGVMTPVWRSGELLLVRRVSVGGETYLQGCWLDWPALQKSLLDGIRDLLPQAALEPAPAPDAQDGSRLMAALPVRLAPGEIDDGAGVETSPLLLSLLVAWGCVLLAVAAVAVLLLGVVTLSERRSAFVSAVTHELRTPLTTFRMYAEMLADGMVTDADSRRRYLETLRIEAGRLTHLVENVLAYARLERGTARGQPEVVAVRDLIDRVASRLRDRASLAAMELVTDAREEALQGRVRADLAGVEQILLNLVDNACKYAASATDRRVHLHVESSDGQVLLRVRDHGPGVATPTRGRLFRPFSKSAVEAAHSAPGVGLGLALSRRMARAMGGELRLEHDGVASDGACFTLSLPKH